ncbi:acyl-CoA thioesterase [Pendulispora brunnea]|uniref:Acyl-CoA thioesterase n=1 Tax=Pendulispora brunnea TaxID=2905690 RepID=A0ABZ2KJ55_9BACT
MLTYDRAVRFEEVDAAGIVFFPIFLNYCHDAMAALFEPLEGGYVRLVMERRIGLPTVHVEADYRAPLRYGDVARLEVKLLHVGSRSFSLGYTITRAADGLPVAEVKHVVVTTDLDAMRAVPIPSDMRALLVRLSAASAP